MRPIFKPIGDFIHFFHHRPAAPRAQPQSEILTRDYLASLSGLEAVPYPGAKRGKNSWGGGLMRKKSLRVNSKKPITPRSAVRERIRDRKETTLSIHVRTVRRLFPSGILDREYKNEAEW